MDIAVETDRLFEANEVINYFNLIEEEIERKRKEQAAKEQQELYVKRLEAAYQQVIQIVRRNDLDEEIKRKVVMKFSEDFPKNPYLLEPEIGIFLPHFKTVVSILSSQDNLGIYINGLYTQFRTPALTQVEVGAIVHLEGNIDKGAWVVTGREKYIRFDRKITDAGFNIYVDTGSGFQMIGYAFRENITQQEFGSVIKSSRDLKVISAKDCWRINFIFSLADCYELQALDLTRTHIADIRALAHLKKLRFLSLRETHVSDISPLAQLKELRWLSLWKTRVEDITPLACLEKLEGLNLIGTEVKDLSPLANLKQLKVVYLNEGKTNLTG